MVRTNNDLEGWHRRLNGRAGNPNLGLYKFVNVIREEADTVDLQIRRKKYAQIHGKLQDAWDASEEEELTTTEMLRKISQITRLGPTIAAIHIIDDDDQ